MSLDLEVWTVDPLLPDRTPPGDVHWARHQAGWSHTGNTWQIVIDDSVEVDEQDIPVEAAAAVAGIRFLTRFTLEPIGAPRSATRLLETIARAFSRRNVGVVYDPQQNSFWSERRAKGTPSTAAGEPTDLISMSWWFPDGPLTTRDGARSLLEYFSQHMPQALPKRYGLFEPAKYRFDPAAPDQFLDLLFAKQTLLFVWECAGPFSISYCTAAPSWHWRPGLGDDAFVVPSLTWAIPASLLNEPGWETEVRRCWRQITLLARPMYADARRLSGYLVRRNRIRCLPNAEGHPIRAGWRGMPKTFGLAVAVGEPYLDHWPAMKSLSAGGMPAMQSVPSWRDGGEVAEILGPPPQRLCMPAIYGLAEFWPFEPKPGPKK